MTFRYMVRTNNGQLLFAEATSIEDALAQLKLESSQVKRHMPVKWIDRPKMADDVKARLKELTEQRRALRRVRPKAEGIGNKKENTVEKTLTRIYKNKTYMVVNNAEGFQVNGGKTYLSLTAAAKAITGYPSISGPRFFAAAPKVEKKAKSKKVVKKPTKKPDLKFSKKAQTASNPKKSLSSMTKAELAKVENSKVGRKSLTEMAKELTKTTEAA